MILGHMILGPLGGATYGIRTYDIDRFEVPPMILGPV